MNTTKALLEKLRDARIAFETAMSIGDDYAAEKSAYGAVLEECRDAKVPEEDIQREGSSLFA